MMIPPEVVDLMRTEGSMPSSGFRGILEQREVSSSKCFATSGEADPSMPMVHKEGRFPNRPQSL